MHYVFPAEQRFHREQRHHRQGCKPNSLIADRRPYQNPDDDVRGQRQRQTSHSNPFSQNWCTGEDSNLRTSLGGADLQSAGFNHSPTCAETPGPSAGSIRARQNSPRLADRRPRFVLRQVLRTRMQNENRARKDLCAQYTTLGKIPYGVPLEKPVTPPRRANALRSGTDSGAGEGI